MASSSPKDNIIASCTPDTLCNLATGKVARLILASAVPVSLRQYAPCYNFHQDCVDLSQSFPCKCEEIDYIWDYTNMNHVILAEESRESNEKNLLLEAKGLLMVGWLV